jgi:UDPglucose--hexose-1-phosphate uridylyltransferase
MTPFDLQQNPHRRFNPLTREWVLVSPHRTQRPWQGQTEKLSLETRPRYDPKCYMCPGNLRAAGVRNPLYEGIFAFDNDYPSLLPHTPPGRYEEKGLLLAESETGVCRVMCFSPRHDLTIPQMERPAIRLLVDGWADEFARLGALPEVDYVQIFENRGEMMGCSNPHPHCQIWASASIPNYPSSELASFEAYQRKHASCLLCDYISLEQTAGNRLVCENEHFFTVVPFWAIWPFETLLISRRHVPDIAAFDSSERDGLADILQHLTIGYDNLFQISFPYSMGFHQRPTNGAHPEWHFHAHFFPPLLRSATVKKFMVGYELLASPQRDITPEAAAEKLRSLPEKHFLKQG